MADSDQQEEERKGFFISNLTAGAMAGLIIFLGAVILFQQQQIDLTTKTMQLLALKISKLQSK